MTGRVILTNNPQVQKKYQADVTMRIASAADVLTAARGMIHKGARLLNHPLSGGVAPRLNPYKSLLLADAPDGERGLDFTSLRHIEEALRVYRKDASVRHRAYSDRALEDFQVLDLDFLESALAAIVGQERN